MKQAEFTSHDYAIGGKLVVGRGITGVWMDEIAGLPEITKELTQRINGGTI